MRGELAHGSGFIYIVQQSVCDLHLMGVCCSHPVCQSKTLGCFEMFVSCFATCVYPHVMPTCYESLFISVSAELHTLTVILLMSPENYSSIYPSYCHFSGLLTDTVKGSGSQSSSFLYSYFPQVLTVREQEKEGRGKGPGEERSRPRSASSWYEVENKSLFS